MGRQPICFMHLPPFLPPCLRLYLVLRRGTNVLSQVIEHARSRFSHLGSPHHREYWKSPYIKHPKSLVAEAVDDMQADSGFGVLGP